MDLKVPQDDGVGWDGREPASQKQMSAVNESGHQEGRERQHGGEGGVVRLKNGLLSFTTEKSLMVQSSILEQGGQGANF